MEDIFSRTVFKTILIGNQCVWRQWPVTDLLLISFHFIISNRLIW